MIPMLCTVQVKYNLYFRDFKNSQLHGLIFNKYKQKTELDPRLIVSIN